MQITSTVYEIRNPYSNESTLTQNHYKLTSISPQTLCCLEIQAVTVCDSSTFLGVPYSICEETITPVPQPVSNLMAPESAIGTQSFDITWDPPQYFDTIPVMYDISVNNQVIENLIETTYLHINNLDPCTMYSVTVYVYSSLSISPSARASTSISVTTKSPLPPPPRNLTFAYNAPQLVVNWNPPLEDSCNRYNIQSYLVRWICNELSGQNVTSTAMTSAAIIDIVSNGESIGQGWCSAQIQSCDSDMRCGDFSSQATATLPQMVPSQPRCFVQTESRSNVSISFAISQPFIADSFNIVWMLNGSRMTNGSFTYDNLSSNTVDLKVESNTTFNTTFNFQLQVCNIYGCSLPCEVNFTTMVSE